jgi:methyl-accepting chemotaxis protein/methyl-accepting chemotaxis protein-1 (serine sensor receptor)
MTIGKRFILTSGALVVFVAAVAGVSIAGNSGIAKEVHSLATDTVPGIVYAGAVRGDVLALRGDYLRHIGETDHATMARIEQDIAADQTSLATDMGAYEESITQPDDRANFGQLKPEIAAVYQGWDQVHALSLAAKNVEAFALYKSAILPQMTVLQAQLDLILDWNRRGADASIAQTAHTVHTLWWLLLILGISSVLVGVGLSWFMIGTLTGQLSVTIMDLAGSADQIVAAAGQVAASSQSLAQGASQQTATIEETSSASAEINSMARRTTENSRSTAEMVSRSQEGFERANQSLAEMVDAMDGINSASQKISKIIKVIDEIAFQTNILALNAAVEAARAGEAGMGFAVVADEVRNLAQRCAQAAKDTADLIEDSIQKSDGGRVKVEQVSIAIRVITADSSKIKVLVDEISLGSVEQSSGIDQISRAIHQMEQVTQSSAANAQQSAAAAEQLNAQAAAMKDVVETLRAMVDGGSAAGHQSGRIMPGNSQWARLEG